MLDKILRWLVLIGVFAIPVVIPFIVSGSMFFPFITGKNFIFRIVTEIILVAWILLALRDKLYRPKFSWILVAVGAFLGVMLLADIFAENPFKAFWSNYERMEGFVSLIHLVVYFVIAGSTLITEKIWINFFRANILASIAMAGYGFLQIAGRLAINQGGVRVDGTFGNATYLAGYMLVMIFLALFLLLREKNNWWKSVYGIALILDLIILFYTATRGALLGLIGGLIMMAIIVAIFEKERKIFRKISIVLAIAVIVLSGTFYALRNSSFVQSSAPLARLTSISANNSDARARFMVWEMAWQGFKERPILGWGQEGFNFVFNKYYNPAMYDREQWFDRAHTILFDWLVAGGILGFLTYFSLIALFFLTLWGVPKKIPRNLHFSISEKAVLTGLCAGYLFQNIFVFDNIVSYILFFSLLAYLHASKSRSIVKFESVSPIPKEDIPRFYAPILIVVLIVVLWFVNVRGILASDDLISALKPQAEGITKNLIYFRSAIGRNGFGDQEIREQLVQAAFTVLRDKSSSITDSTRLDFLTFAISEMKKQIDAVPNDARGAIFLASLYSVSGSGADAIKYYEKALILSPQKQMVKVSLASEYLRIGEKQKALNLAKSAYESSPQFTELAIQYAAVAIYAGQNNTANNVLVSAFGDARLNDNRIIQAYLDTKQYDKAVEITRLALIKSPENLQLYMTAAAVFIQSNQRNKAVQVLEQAIGKFPSFKTQGEFYISEIKAGRNP